MKRSKLLVVVALVAVVALLYFVNPTDYMIMPKCLFKVLTGWDCPGCGLQRCIHAMVHGRFVEGIGYNYFLLCAGPYVLSFMVAYFMPEGRARTRLTQVIEHRVAICAFLVLFGIWFVVRNLLGI